MATSTGNTIEKTDFEIFRGDTVPFDCEVTIKDTDGVSEPVDISAGTLWFSAKTNKDDLDEDAIIQVSYLVPTDADSVLGKCLFELSAADTAVEAGKYWYDFQFVNSNNKTFTLGWGKLTVLQDITQRAI